MGDLTNKVLPPGAMDILMDLAMGNITPEEAEKRVRAIYGGLNRIEVAKSLSAFGKHDRALKQLQSLPGGLVDSVDAHTAFAEIHYSAGDPARALEHCDRALEISPGDSLVLALKVAVCLGADRVEEAHESGRALLRAAPSEMYSHFALGSVFLMKSRYDKALEYFETALARAPGSTEVKKTLGYCHLCRGELDQAEKFYREALADHPLDVEILGILARLSRGEGKLDEALQLARDALKLRPDRPGATLVDTVKLSIESREKGRAEDGPVTSAEAYAKLQRLMDRYFPGGQKFIYSRFPRDTIARYCEKRSSDRCLNFLLHLNKFYRAEWKTLSVLQDMSDPRAFTKMVCRGCKDCLARFKRADRTCLEAARYFKLGEFGMSLHLLLRSVIIEDSYRPAHLFLKQALPEFASSPLPVSMTGGQIAESRRLLDVLLIDVTEPESLLNCARFLCENCKLEMALPFFVGWADVFIDRLDKIDIRPGRNDDIIAGGCRIPIDRIIDVLGTDEAYFERFGSFTMISRSRSRKLLPVLEKMEPVLARYWDDKDALVREKIEEISSI